MAEHLDEQVDKIFKRLTNVPSLPEAVGKLLKLPEDASPRDFAELIATDQGLTIKVLRLVNSAFYSLRRPVSSLHHGCMLLGTRTLKSVVLSVSMMQLFREPRDRFDPRRYWRHSLAVAIAAQKLGVRLGSGREDDLYVCGLLHDSGIGLLAQYLEDDYALALRLREGEARPLREIEEELFGVSHCEVGYTLTKRWKLPDTIAEVIRFHEAEPEKLSAAGVSEEVRVDVAVLRAAEVEAAARGFGFFDDPETTDAVKAAEIAAALPGPLAGEELAALIGNLEEDVARTEELLEVNLENAGA